jgi:hypothetical protein
MKFLAIFSAVLLAVAPAHAESEGKFLDLWWWPSHWVNQDFVPYFDTATEPHNTQWNSLNKNWTPQEWITQDGGDAVSLVNRWVQVGILEDRYVDGKIPVVIVGPNFYHLSGNDKRRVAATLDYVYALSAKSPPSMFYLEDWRTEEKIGYYTNRQLILQ